MPVSSLTLTGEVMMTSPFLWLCHTYLGVFSGALPGEQLNAFTSVNQAGYAQVKWTEGRGCHESV